MKYNSRKASLKSRADQVKVSQQNSSNLHDPSNPNSLMSLLGTQVLRDSDIENTEADNLLAIPHKSSDTSGFIGGKKKESINIDNKTSISDQPPESQADKKSSFSDSSSDDEERYQNNELGSNNRDRSV